MAAQAAAPEPPDLLSKQLKTQIAGPFVNFMRAIETLYWPLRRRWQ
jgi:hypothetical protein